MPLYIKDWCHPHNLAKKICVNFIDFTFFKFSLPGYLTLSLRRKTMITLLKILEHYEPKSKVIERCKQQEENHAPGSK